MIEMRLGEVGQAVGVQVSPDVADRIVSGVAIDSREVVAGDLFVALAGERFDGAQFIPQAFSRGAAAYLVPSNQSTSRSRGRHRLSVAAKARFQSDRFVRRRANTVGP